MFFLILNFISYNTLCLRDIRCNRYLQGLVDVYETNDQLGLAFFPCVTFRLYLRTENLMFHLLVATLGAAGTIFSVLDF